MSIGAVGGGNSMISSLLMKAMDQDKSGTASLEEFTSVGQSLEGASFDQSDDALSKAFSSLDSDQDGALTKDEIAQGLAKFSQESAGALLDAQEAAGPPPPPPGGEDGGGFFAEADADGSGSVSLAEFTAAGPKSAASDEVDSLFAEIDQDGDGEISSSEDEAFRMAQGPQGGGGPQGAGGPPPPPQGASGEASEDTEDDATSQLVASLSELLNANGTYGSASASMFDEALSSLFAASA